MPTFSPKAIIGIVLAVLITGSIVCANFYISYLRGERITLQTALTNSEKDFASAKKALEVVNEYYEIDKEVKDAMFSTLSTIDARKRPVVGDELLTLPKIK